MALIKDALAFILENYAGSESDLSNARVTKMIYLADWHQAINYSHQITPIEWAFDNYGPFVWEVYKTAAENQNIFKVKNIPNLFGNPKALITIQDRAYNPELSKEEKQSLQHVINETYKLSWNKFIELVYSTYPIMSSERYSKLDLVQKANEYQAIAA